MGIDVEIGVLADKKHVRFEQLPDAHEIEDCWMKPRINAWSMTISGWHAAVRRIGIFNIVDCDDFGCWEWGVYHLTDRDLDQIVARCEAIFRKHPGVQPKCRASEEEFDVAVATWFSWWARWAQRQTMPVYLKVGY